MEDTCETPRLVLEGLGILDLNEKDVTGLRSLNLEWAGEVVDTGEVDVLDVVCGVIVADLAAGPVHAFDLDDFTVGDLASEGDYRGRFALERRYRSVVKGGSHTVWMPSVLDGLSASSGSAVSYLRR